MSNHLLIGIAEEKTEGKLCLTTYDWNCRGEDRGPAMSNHLLIVAQKAVGFNSALEHQSKIEIGKNTTVLCTHTAFCHHSNYSFVHFAKQ